MCCRTNSVDSFIYMWAQSLIPTSCACWLSAQRVQPVERCNRFPAELQFSHVQGQRKRLLDCAAMAPPGYAKRHRAPSASPAVPTVRKNPLSCLVTVGPGIFRAIV